VEPSLPLVTQAPPPPTEPPPSPNPNWEQIAGVRPFRNLYLGAAAWTGTRFLVTSGNFILSSADGRVWHREQRFDTEEVQRFAIGPTAILAVGYSRPWVSADGLTWHQAPDSPVLTPGKNRVLTLSDAVATDDGWLAVGSEGPDQYVFAGFRGVTGTVWHSADGLSWTRDPALAAMHDAGIVGVARVGDGFLAVGNATARPVDHIAVWRSADGISWNRVPDAKVFGPPAGFEDLSVLAAGVAVAGSTVVVVGWTYVQDIGGTALAWRSTDGGATWQRATLQGASDGQMSGVTAVPGGFAAVGWGRGCHALWLSTDGAEWTCASTPSMSKFIDWGVAASDTTLLLTGFGGGPVKDEAVAWMHDLRTLPVLQP
jgi:hypothetical protein